MSSLFLTNLMFLVVVQDQTETDFNDLGKLMLVGVVVALVLAIALTFVRLRLRDRKPEKSHFVSIGSRRDKE